MSGYTKGPWITVDDDPQFVYALNEYGSNRFWFRVQSAMTDNEAGIDELKANGRLAAAAPELLEALEYAVDELQEWLDDQGIYGTARYSEIIPKYRALIAKAKGEMR